MHDIRLLAIFVLASISISLTQTSGTQTSGSASGQTSRAGSTISPASSPEFSTVDSLISEMYAVISGAAGKPRDWDRLRLLFYPEAHLIRNGPIERRRIFRRRVNA